MYKIESVSSNEPLNSTNARIEHHFLIKNLRLLSYRVCVCVHEMFMRVLHKHCAERRVSLRLRLVGQRM